MTLYFQGSLRGDDVNRDALLPLCVEKREQVVGAGHHLKVGTVAVPRYIEYSYASGPHINLDSISDILLIINLLKYDFFRLHIYGGRSMAFYVEFITNFAARITVSSAHLRQHEKLSSRQRGNGYRVLK